MKITRGDLEAAIARGREQLGVEFKGPGPRAGHKEGRVIRAMMAMANKPDGGFIVVGVDERDGDLHPVGVSADDASTWTHDDLANKVSVYAEPRVEFDISRIDLSGKLMVVIDVEEFAEVPVLCKKEYTIKPAKGTHGKVEVLLRPGGLYVRGHGKIASREVETYSEMREVLDRAAEKRVRALLGSIRRVGLLPEAERAQVQDAKPYDDELGGLL